MTSRIPESSFTWWIDWSPVTIMGNTLPPRDPNDDDDDDDAEDGEEENQSDEPAVVREPDDE
jgi:hypothetical protein